MTSKLGQSTKTPISAKTDAELDDIDALFGLSVPKDQNDESTFKVPAVPDKRRTSQSPVKGSNEQTLKVRPKETPQKAKTTQLRQKIELDIEDFSSDEEKDKTSKSPRTKKIKRKTRVQDSDEAERIQSSTKSKRQHSEEEKGKSTRTSRKAAAMEQMDVSTSFESVTDVFGTYNYSMLSNKAVTDVFGTYNYCMLSNKAVTDVFGTYNYFMLSNKALFLKPADVGEKFPTYEICCGLANCGWVHACKLSSGGLIWCHH